jgi:putative salt-induced outer membrane protein YdiY
MRLILGIVLVLTWVGRMSAADVVIFKNGDKLSGIFVQAKGSNVELKSDALGDVTIPLEKVQSVSVSAQAVIMVKGQKPMPGQVERLSSGDWQVSAEGKTRTVAAATVDTVMPVATYHALIEHVGKPWQDWKGSASLGYALQRGNQRTSTISSSIAATRERPEAPVFSAHWRTLYGLTMLYSKAEQTGVLVKSNTLSTNLRQDYVFTPRDFVFGLAQLDHIQPQGLYLRHTYGGGYGHDVIHNDRTIFSLLGGFVYVHEKFFTGPSDSAAEALAGEKLGMQITKNVRLDHSLNFYPNLSDTGQYRFDTTTTLSVKLSGKFSLNTNLIDLYLSNPMPGNKKNNVAFTTGLGYTF